MQALFGFGFVFAGSVSGEQDGFLVQPGQAALGAAVGQLPGLAILQQPDVRNIFVALYLGLADDEGRFCPFWGKAELGKHLHAAEIVDLNLLHQSSPP